MNKKSTKRALLTSIVSLMICCTMLIGTTFAWFTDTVTSGGNKIQAGNLDVDLYLGDGNGNYATEITDDSDPIFGTAGIAQNSTSTLWEPGKTQVAYFKLANNGNLDLKYEVKLVVKNSVKDLHKAMQYAIIADAKKLAEVDWNSATKNDIASTGVLDTQATGVNLGKGAEHYFALAIHMKEEAGNEYQGGSVDFDIIVNATQLASEADSFGTTYDEAATMPVTSYASVPVDTASTFTEIEVYKPNTVNEKVAVVNVPKAALEDGVEEIEVIVVPTVVDSTVTVESDQKAETFDVSVTGIKEDNTEEVKVELFVGKGLTGVKLYHKNVEVPNAVYNSSTGYVIFNTTSFSPFTVVYDAKATEGVPGEPGEALPVATVTDVSGTYANTTLEWKNVGGYYPTAGANQQLEAVFEFAAPHDSSSVENSKYKDWYCDYYVSMDRYVADGALVLGGNYGKFGWVGFNNTGFAVEANKEVPLLGTALGGESNWTYEMIVKLVEKFLCGVAHVDESLNGATFTVELRLTDPETGNKHTANKITYTFDNTPAKVVTQ